MGFEPILTESEPHRIKIEAVAPQELNLRLNPCKGPKGVAAPSAHVARHATVILLYRTIVKNVLRR